MARPDLLLDDSMDREMVAGKYMTSEEHHQLRVKKTIVIQRCALRGGDCKVGLNYGRALGLLRIHRDWTADWMRASALR